MLRLDLVKPDQASLTTRVLAFTLLATVGGHPLLAILLARRPEDLAEFSLMELCVSEKPHRLVLEILVQLYLIEVVRIKREAAGQHEV